MEKLGRSGIGTRLDWPSNSELNLYTHPRERARPETEGCRPHWKHNVLMAKWAANGLPSQEKADCAPCQSTSCTMHHLHGLLTILPYFAPHPFVLSSGCHTPSAVPKMHQPTSAFVLEDAFHSTMPSQIWGWNHTDFARHWKLSWVTALGFKKRLPKTRTLCWIMWRKQQDNHHEKTWVVSEHFPFQFHFQ